MWDSASSLAAGPVELVYYVDEDDDTYQGSDFGPMATQVSGPRIVLSQMWNECYARSSGDICMHAGDDIVFRTKGWDTIVREAIEKYEDRIAFVFGDDGHFGASFGTHGFIHRLWAETVGYFVPPYFVSDWNDQWLNDVARAIGRHVYVPILTEHLHYVFGKSEFDSTYQERLARHASGDPDGIYRAKADERDADAVKLRGVMAG